jgi:membrane-associated phospholipid phosphatase
MKKISFLLVFIFVNFNAVSQTKKQDTLHHQKDNRFNYKALIIPTSLIGYGALSLYSDKLTTLDISIRNSINSDNEKTFPIDEGTQSLAFLSVYGLNLFGIKGKNNFKDRSIVLATAYLIMGSSVTVLKKATHRQRPNQTGYTSFPSGHTATAFMGAEFLYQEYKDVSPWYGVSGYFIAAGTGYLRMYNNKHWFSDVIAAAGIGILSTKIAYWVQPFFKELFSKKETTTKTAVIPYYNKNEVGLAMSMSF